MNTCQSSHHHRHQTPSVYNMTMSANVIAHPHVNCDSTSSTAAVSRPPVDTASTAANLATNTTTIIWKPLNEYFPSDYQPKSSVFIDASSTSTTKPEPFGANENVGSGGRDAGLVVPVVPAVLTAQRKPTGDNVCRSTTSPTIVGVRIKGSCAARTAAIDGVIAVESNGNAAAVHIPLATAATVSDNEWSNHATNRPDGNDDGRSAAAHSLSDLFVRKLHELEVAAVAQRLNGGASLMETAALLGEQMRERLSKYCNG